MIKENSDIVRFDNVSFKYPGAEKEAIKDISFSIKESEFIVICGQSGCGKSTLLAHMKKNHIPFGNGKGQMYYHDTPIEELEDKVSAAKIGFVAQDFESQTVSDKVWHELAFGLESLGVDNSQMKRRIAEMAEYFGIGNIFHNSINELSGGQKQIVALASVMVMQPEILILDEPTAQLDPIAAEKFINTLIQINREFSTTIVISEQRLDDIIPAADRVMIMHESEILGIAQPSALADIFEKSRISSGDEIPVFNSLPAAMQMYMNDKKYNSTNGVPGSIYDCMDMPISVRDGKNWLKKRIQIKEKKESFEDELKDYKTSKANDCKVPVPDGKKTKSQDYEKLHEFVLNTTELIYGYSKGNEIIKNISVEVPKGSLFAIMGGNGSGKTTLLKLMAGIIKPWSGKIKTNGRISYLTQNPMALFTEITVEDELAEMFEVYGRNEKKEKDENIIALVNEMLNKMELTEYRKMHPYDLSGGQAQRLALGKVLLTNPDILLLDEPAKGLDARFKKILSEILKKLQSEGITIIMVSHDMDFVAENATHCALLFDGDIVINTNRTSFFKDNRFYTTQTRRICAGIIDDCITCQEVQEILCDL